MNQMIFKACHIEGGEREEVRNGLKRLTFHRRYRSDVNRSEQCQTAHTGLDVIN
ncbi:hypothetical protein J6590_030941 [Homalodisca vitripennis]|nr:hypothetical protein J6590_030941 [Homalodisca vitripennis]